METGLSAVWTAQKKKKKNRNSSTFTVNVHSSAVAFFGHFV